MAIAEVIQYEGNNTTFIWKHPTTDFHTGTQLIVHESQEAIFFLNGQALDLFGPGRHTLQTENIPLIRKAFNKVFGKDEIFHCEVYFINKVVQMAIKWGTDSQVEYMDPQYHFPLRLGASGEMSLAVGDSRKLLIKLVGTENALTQEKLVGYFRSMLMPPLKSYFAQTMERGDFSIFSIDSQLDFFSRDLCEKLQSDFTDYGILLQRFLVTNVVKPENDPNYKRFKDLHFAQFGDVAEAQLRQKVAVIEQQTEAQKTVIDASAQAQKRTLEGYTYQQEQAFDVARRAAENEGVGTMSSAGIGLGMMGGMATGFGPVIGGIVSSSMSSLQGGDAPAGQPAGQAPDLFFGAQMPPTVELKTDAAHAQKPASEQGTPAGPQTLKDRIANLKMLREEGLLTDAEFEEQRRALIAEATK